MADDLQRTSDAESRRRLRSASTASLVVPATKHWTIGDRAFPVAAAHAWNSLPDDVTSLPAFNETEKRTVQTIISRHWPVIFYVLCCTVTLFHQLRRISLLTFSNSNNNSNNNNNNMLWGRVNEWNTNRQRNMHVGYFNKAISLTCNYFRFGRRHVGFYLYVLRIHISMSDSVSHVYSSSKT